MNSGLTASSACCVINSSRRLRLDLRARFRICMTSAAVGQTGPSFSESSGTTCSKTSFVPEVIGGRNGIWQSMQGSFTEVRREQKGPHCSRALDRGRWKGSRANYQNKAIGVTKDLFRH
jgi:hypothetical protein